MTASSLLRACVVATTGVLIGAVGGVVLVSPALAPSPPTLAPEPPGLRVESVSGESPFAQLGLRAGDVIETVDPRGESIYISLLRDGRRLQVVARGVQNPFPELSPSKRAVDDSQPNGFNQ